MFRLTLFGKTGTIIWDGQLENTSYINPGIYILFISLQHQTPKRFRQKITFILMGI